MTGMLNLANAKIGFRNFEGVEGMYNKAGDRNFVVFLDDEKAKELESIGWNIKWPKPNDEIEDDNRRPYLSISVSVDKYPANIFMINGNHKNKLDAETLATLDWAEFELVDLVIRPYTWSVSGKSGIKAYLQTGYFTIVQDDFASKYEL